MLVGCLKRPDEPEVDSASNGGADTHLFLANDMILQSVAFPWFPSLLSPYVKFFPPAERF